MKLKFGVPCSKLKDRIKDVEIACTSEEQAMGICAGCILSGEKPEIYLQNSGLGRILDVALSLYQPYEIPYPKMILSIRRHPEHHKYMGAITYGLLEFMQYKDLEIIEQEEE